MPLLATVTATRSTAMLATTVSTDDDANADISIALDGTYDLDATDFAL